MISIDAPEVFEGPTFTFEDDRFVYLEQRFVTLGFVGGIPVSVVHTETAARIHIICFRKATRNEKTILFENIQNGLGASAYTRLAHYQTDGGAPGG